MIATIQIGGPNGPLAQGDLLPIKCFCDGEASQIRCPVFPACKTAGPRTILDGESTYTGRMVHSYRRKG